MSAIKLQNYLSNYKINLLKNNFTWDKLVVHYINILYNNFQLLNIQL